MNRMKRIQISERIKPLCLIVPLLLSACHTAPLRPGSNDVTAAGHVPAGYIDPTKSLFPLGNYPQFVDKWFPPGPDRHVPVMDTAAQQRHFSDLKSRYFGMGADEKSPWNPSYIASVLSQGTEAGRDVDIRKYLGEQSVSCGENFRVHPGSWKKQVRDNATTSVDRVYRPSKRGIAVREALVRGLPTDDPAYDDPRQAGQGYSFDNLQMSSVRPGTPVYLLAASRDRRWPVKTLAHLLKNRFPFMKGDSIILRHAPEPFCHSGIGSPVFLTLLFPCVKAMAVHKFARSDSGKMSLSQCHRK